jgi:Protein of unknown function (DUF3987)/RepB DNA-primase from phage plasmid
VPVIDVSAETNQLRSTFFRLVFGQKRGIVCLAFMVQNKRSLTEEFFKWPDDENLVLEFVNKHYLAHNMYFCPNVFSTQSRTKESVKSTPTAWADLDTCDPKNLLVKPSVTIESSPSRFQALWLLDDIDPDDAEDISRRIAYSHADQGADKSGWDLTQLLRVPLTYNYKYGDDYDPPVVTIAGANRNQYRINDFEVYPQATGYEYLEIPFPTILPDESGDEVLQRWRLKINPLCWNLFSETPASDWSKKLWQLEMLCFEAGISREEVYVIARDAACNKYSRDGRSTMLLWKDVCRAGSRSDANAGIVATRDDDLPSLLTEEERKVVIAQPDSFVEKYITWAKTLGDAASQYHQAGAFVTLSSLLAGNIRLPTSFGTILPNLWFMILADTTLTRKSTAMDIAMDLLMEIDSDVMLATDGSIEGLLTTLATRPGRPSVFLRDEFSGLLEMMNRKDYYAGMPEMLTKMYDGKMQKRVLRKEIIDVRDPVLVLFAGGIKNRITSLLSFEHIASGFMPRFVFITAESDITKVRPIGPPTEAVLGDRDKIKAELVSMFTHYNKTILAKVQDLNVEIPQKKRWDATLTPDAWVRYNKLESDMVQAGMGSQNPDIMMPTYDRLSKSILKAAVLLAASRQRSDYVVVELDDILRAIHYGEQWRMFVRDVMNGVGKGTTERQLDQIIKFLSKKGTVSRSILMQNFHLTARDTNAILETLEQRGLIVRTTVGKGQQITFRGSTDV